jgi:hypothetical protein
MVMVSDQPWPRVMRRLPVRGRRSVDRGHAGLAIELRNHLISGCRPCDLVGKAIRYVALMRVAHRTRGVREPEHVCKLFVRKPGDPRGDWLLFIVGPVGEGQRPNARHVRSWEVGRRNSIDEANEQRCTTRDKRPTTGGVRGEKASGRGEPCSAGRDRHTGAGISVDRTEQGTRSSGSTLLRLTRGRSPVR